MQRRDLKKCKKNFGYASDERKRRSKISRCSPFKAEQELQARDNSSRQDSRLKYDYSNKQGVTAVSRIPDEGTTTAISRL
jgi:hypothetical protein